MTDLNLSLWAVDASTGKLSPLPDFTSLNASPVRNAPGSITVVYPADGINYALLHANVTSDRDIEVEIWLTGSNTGARRGYLTDTAVDDASETKSATFTGAFLEMRPGEAVVFPQVAPLGNSAQELVLSAATAGTVMSTLITQAHTRGALTDITIDFTGTVDSAGASWPLVISTKYSPGTTYLQVLDNLVLLGLAEWSITADHVLHMWRAGGRGTDRTTGATPLILRHGKNLVDAPRKHSVKASATALLAAGGANMYASQTDTSALARRGRRVEAFASANNLTDSGSVTAFAAAELAVRSPGQMEVTHGVGFLGGEPMPGAAFDVADWVNSDTVGTLERLRVAQWSLTQSNQPGTSPSGTVSLNDLTTDALAAQEARLNAIQSSTATIGTSGGGVDTSTPNPPTALTASSTAFLDGGTPKASVVVGWTAPTQNTDSTTLNDLASYVVQFALAGSPTTWNAGNTAPAGTTSASFSTSPGASISIRVAALDYSGHQSAWSTPLSHTTASDVTAPPTASTPTAANYLGVLLVNWDGKTSTGADMLGSAADFDHVEVHLSTSSGFTPSSATYVDRLFAAGSLPVANLPYAVTQFTKLLAVDRSGNKSGASAQASATPSQVLSADLFAGCVGSAALASLAVLTANIANLAVNDAQIGNLSVGKLTAGTFSATMTISGIIRTASSGARAEIDGAGIRLYNSAGTNTVTLNAADGSALITGTLQSALTGTYWTMMTDGTFRHFSSGFSGYAQLTSLNGDLIMRGRLDANSRSGRVNANLVGVGINFSSDAEITAGNLRAEVVVLDRVVQYNSPNHILRLNGKQTPTFSGRWFDTLESDSSGLDLAATVLRRINVGGLPAWIANGQNAGWLFNSSTCLAVDSSGGSFVAVNASAFNTISSRLVKRAEADIAFPADGGPVSALGVVCAVPAREWEYLHEQRGSRAPTPDVTVRRPRLGPDGTQVVDDELGPLWDHDEAGWDWDEPDAPKHYGPMAEDLAAVAPTLVRHHGGHMLTDLRDLVGVTWGATAELEARVRRLESLLADRGVVVVDGDVAA